MPFVILYVTGESSEGKIGLESGLIPETLRIKGVLVRDFAPIW